jgi:hypothetical protein
MCPELIPPMASGGILPIWSAVIPSMACGGILPMSAEVTLAIPSGGMLAIVPPVISAGVFPYPNIIVSLKYSLNYD